MIRLEQPDNAKPVSLDAMKKPKVAGTTANGLPMAPAGAQPISIDATRPTAAPVPVAQPVAQPGGTTITSTVGQHTGGPAPAAPAPAPSPAPSAAPTLTPTDPNNPLTSQTIAPSIMDRTAIAQRRFDEFVDSTGPAYQAALRDAKRAGAAVGGIGSGKLRTSIGDLGNERLRALDLERRGVFTDALNGMIDDSRFATGVAQQQQGFQQGQQDRAFDQGFAVDNAEFQRALQTLLAGQGGDPTGALGDLSGTYSTQGAAASQSFMDLLRQLAAQRSGGSPPVTTSVGTPVPWSGGVNA